MSGRFEVIRRYSRKRIRQSLFEKSRVMPHIQIIGRNVYCGSVLIPTDRKPLTLELFSAFIENPPSPLTTASLMKRVYYSDYCSEMSHYYTESLQQKLIKLISRSRSLAESSCRGTEYEGIGWFSYSKYTMEWSLLSFSPKFILDWEFAASRRKPRA